MENKKIKLPDFNTINEMSEFFDKTDTTLIDGFEEVDINFVKAAAASPVRGVVRKKRSVRQG